MCTTSCALLFGVVSVASADSISIVGGSGSLYFSGDLTSTSLTATDSSFVTEHHVGAPCCPQPGQTFTPSTTIPMTNSGGHPLGQLYHGVRYSAWLSGSLTITADPIAVPIPSPNDEGKEVSFTTGFRMTGTITAYATQDRTGTPLFSTTVTSDGTETLGPYRVNGGQYIPSNSFDVLMFTSRPAHPIPAPWQSRDIGAVGISGYAYQDVDGDLLAGGSGVDIWGAADAFQFVYQPVKGDVEIAIPRPEQDATNAFAKAGIMIRQNLTPGSPHVIFDVKPDNGLEFMTRTTQDGQTTFLGGAPLAGFRLHLTRRGTMVTATICGDTCQEVGTTPWIDGPAFVGVAVTSHDNVRLNTALFAADMPSVTEPTGTLPPPWQFTDVGDVGQPGHASSSNGVFTVAAAGADIWGSADSFGAVTQTLSGDGAIAARVVSEDGAHPFAKAGVTIGAMSPTSSRAIVDVKPDGGLEFMVRDTDGGSMSFIAGAATPFPAWVRLTRRGSAVQGDYSSDGQTWNSLGTATVSWPAAVAAGLAVTSHDTSLLNTATFDTVTVTPASTGGTNLLVNAGFEGSAVPGLAPGWVSDAFRQTAAQSETTAPHSGAKDGACRTTQSLDCGIFQEVTVASTGNYAFSVFAAADKPGALIGVNINGVDNHLSVAVDVSGYREYDIAFAANAGDVIRVWAYSPASAGALVIDDATLAAR
jgi:regulation of enolase protein 1 (concanavalin A-like superfamily)